MIEFDVSIIVALLNESLTAVLASMLPLLIVFVHQVRLVLIFVDELGRTKSTGELEAIVMDAKVCFHL